MIDLTKYTWLKPHLPLPETLEEQEDFQDILKAIEKKESNLGLRNLYANYYLDQLQKAKEEGRSLHYEGNLGKEIRSWAKSQSFKKFKEMYLKEDKAVCI